MNHIYSKYIEARQKDIVSYIEENIVDGDILDNDGKRYVFLATNGSWQTKYLSLYEMLHDKYIAKYCAKLLLDDYLEKHSPAINQILASGLIAEEARAKLYNQVAFTKIVTVTVSSQLIGVALRNLIRDDAEKKYDFLRNPEEQNRLKSCPELLRLSSYYSFDEEKPFKDISDKDRVIVVNDVISTGSLIYKISKKINDKQAKLNAVFSIADTRVTEFNLLTALSLQVKNGQETAVESPYIFGSKDEEELFFTLVKCNEQKHALRKYQRPYKGTAEVKRINPLLNTIVELETKHSEEKRVLFRKPENLINNAIIDELHFKVGHFRQNLSHNGYLTDMHHLFSTDGENSPGEKLLGAIKIRLDEFLNEQKPSTTIIDNILHNIELLLKEYSNNEKLINVSKEMSAFAQLFAEESLSTIISFKPDYIFYPPFSGIEQLSETILNKYFGTSIENIICLQRFDTNKGWRFPFPAKWYNHLTKDKSVLILDSGSLTGESLVQLVDSISFLDVKEITVLCAISRIEDFYREFYSRLKFSKVKILQASDTTTEEEKSKQRQHIIPLNIIFGTNLNIPVFPSKISCPFCEELRELNQYTEKANSTEPSEWTVEYIKNRKIEIAEINLEALEIYETPYYLPLVRSLTQDKQAVTDSLELFLMRDKVGKIDSYRFYKDYFEDFDDLKTDIEKSGLYDSKNLKQIELILGVIIHEPKLLRTLKDLLIDIDEYCSKVVEEIVFTKTRSLDELFYKWNHYSFLRLAIILFPGKFKISNSWLILFDFSLQNKKALSYLSFLLWEGFLGTSKILNNQSYVDIMSEFSDRLDNISIESNPIFNNNDFRKIIKSISNKFESTRVISLNDAYFNLRKFFFGQTSSNSHNELVKELSNFESIIKNEDKTVEDIHNIFKLSEIVSNYLHLGILENLNYIKANQRVKKYDELHYNYFFGKDGVREKLIFVLKKIPNTKEEKKKIIDAKDFIELRALYDSVNEFYIQYVSEISSFNKICKEFKAGFFDCLGSLFSISGNVAKANTGNKAFVICGHAIIFDSNHTIRKTLSEKILTYNSLQNYNEVYLSITKNFLEGALEEILINAFKHCTNSEIKIDIKIEIADTSTKISIIQREHRVNRNEPITLKEIFGAFCDDSNVSFIDDEKEGYIIEAIFNTYKLKLSE